MGKYDTCMKEFLQNKDRFADLFNGCCFQGRQIIRAEDLREASENYVITDKRLPGKTRQKDTEIIRDVKMVLGSGMVLQVLAVENQSYIDYAMPVRCMGYDAAEYRRQLKERKQERRLLMNSENRPKNPAVSMDETLSGILSSDRLHPVYTLCLYSGTEPWDGPRKLSDMMAFDPQNKNLQSLFEEYHLHLFCINEQYVFDAFRSDLKPLFQAINCRNNKKKMIELMKDETYSHLNEDTWDAIAVMTDNAAMLQKKDLYKTENQKEEFNMCQALQELMQDERNEGRIEGRNEGKIEDQKIVIRNMINRGYKTEDICAIAECNPAFVKEVETELALT
jgi:putative transposase